MKWYFQAMLAFAATEARAFTVLLAPNDPNCGGLVDVCTADYEVCCNNGPNKLYQSAQTSGLSQQDTFQIFSSQNNNLCAVSLGVGSLGTAPICLDGGTLPFITGAIIHNGPARGKMRKLKRAPKSVGPDGYGYIENGIAYTIQRDSAEAETYHNLTSIAEKEDFIKAHHTWTGAID